MAKYTLSLDASQLSQFMECPTKWKLAYKDNLRLATEKTTAMDKGSCMHFLLETFYKLQIQKNNRDQNALAAMELAKEAKIFDEYKLTKEEGKHINLRFNEYLLFYRFSDFTPASINGVDGVELGFSKIIHETDSVCFILEGKIDIVVDNPVGLIFWDHKCTGFTYFEHKLQLLAYAWATGFRYGGYNYISLAKTSKKAFRRKPVHFPDHLIERWKANTIQTFYKAKQSILCDTFEENLNTCSGPYDSNPCVYVPLCESENQQTKETIENFSYYKKEKWEPWKI